MFQDNEVAPGSKRNFKIPISDGVNESFIPITIFHGNQSGPTLGITAGVHGYEYSPILAGQKLIDEIDVATLKGTVILVLAANVESFLGRSPYNNPIDGKNLNRSFPGAPKGTMTERIADFISTSIIPRCTHFIDAHSGDAPEDLIPYSGFYYNDTMPEVSSQGKKMAVDLGFDYVLIFETTGKDYMKTSMPSLYCSAEAFKQGIPAADIECGRLGLVEQENVDKIVRGILNLMNGLEMTIDKPFAQGKYLLIEERATIQSESTGFIYPSKSAGDYVTKGMKLGYITDFFGDKLQEIYAPESGVILYMLSTPPVNEGETLVSIGLISNE